MRHIKYFESLSSLKYQEIITDIFEDSDINAFVSEGEGTIDVSIVSSQREKENMSNEFVQKLIKMIWMYDNQLELFCNGIKDPILTRIYKLTGYHLKYYHVAENFKWDMRRPVRKRNDKSKVPDDCTLFLFFSPGLYR